MPDYEVTAYISAEVKMFVHAENAEEAKALLREHLAIDATLVDVPPENFTLITDSIDQIEMLSAQRSNPKELAFPETAPDAARGGGETEGGS